jgi:hypothetical protein
LTSILLKNIVIIKVGFFKKHEGGYIFTIMNSSDVAVIVRGTKRQHEDTHIEDDYMKKRDRMIKSIVSKFQL